jgi:hypothetical protein
MHSVRAGVGSAKMNKFLSPRGTSGSLGSSLRTREGRDTHLGWPAGTRHRRCRSISLQIKIHAPYLLVIRAAGASSPWAATQGRTWWAKREGCSPKTGGYGPSWAHLLRVSEWPAGTHRRSCRSISLNIKIYTSCLLVRRTAGHHLGSQAGKRNVVGTKRKSTTT